MTQCNQKLAHPGIPRRPWPNPQGAHCLVLEPGEFLRRLAALVPAPYTNLVRYHGVFAGRSRWRKQLPAPPRKTPSGLAEPPSKVTSVRLGHRILVPKASLRVLLGVPQSTMPAAAVVGALRPVPSSHVQHSHEQARFSPLFPREVRGSSCSFCWSIQSGFRACSNCRQLCGSSHSCLAARQTGEGSAGLGPLPVLLWTGLWPQLHCRARQVTKNSQIDCHRVRPERMRHAPGRQPRRLHGM